VYPSTCLKCRPAIPRTQHQKNVRQGRPDPIGSRYSGVLPADGSGKACSAQQVPQISARPEDDNAVLRATGPARHEGELLRKQQPNRLRGSNPSRLPNLRTHCSAS
jgi:hypothetical protein